MNHAHKYCKNVDGLPKEEAINALHQALMQFNAIERGTENVDNKPVMAEIQRLLIVVGHVGFAPVPEMAEPPKTP